MHVMYRIQQGHQGLKQCDPVAVQNFIIHECCFSHTDRMSYPNCNLTDLSLRTIAEMILGLSSDVDKTTTNEHTYAVFIEY